MALRTILTEIVLYMIGIGYIVIIILMARPAIGRGTRVPVGVTIDTVERDVGSCQRELCLRMIEHCRLPAVGGMAGFTGGGKPGGLVIGVGGVIVIILMTGETFRRRSRIPACVTIDTIQKRMRAGYGKLPVSQPSVVWHSVQSWLKLLAT
jgi:hypothetical protein